MKWNTFKSWLRDQTGLVFDLPSVTLDSGAVQPVLVEVEAATDRAHLTLRAGEYAGLLEVERQDEKTFSFRCTWTPVGTPADKLRAASVLRLCLPWDADTRAFVNGETFQEGIFSVGELPEHTHCRDFFTIYQKGMVSDGLTLTTKLPAKFASRLELDRSSADISLNAETTIPYSYEGPIVCQEWILALHTDSAVAFLNAAQRCAVDKHFEQPVGWSTWDYFFTSATQEDVKANADFIASDSVLREKIHYIALDDGWQQREGDWRSGIRYPDGLKTLVSYLRERGFEAGIWIAPTRLHNLCGTVMRRHDFLVRDEFGDPVADEDMYVLDPTHPDGEAFLRETFTYLADCGFTYYKLDFISNMLTCANRFYDTSAGPYDALRRLFTIVRETVPAGSHLAGCSLPYATGAGIADSRRTGWDIHNVWGHVKACVGTYIPQFAANGKIHRNDLDYLVVRGPDTSCDPQTNVLNPSAGANKANKPQGFVWRGGEDFSLTEARTWCTIMLMTGSSLFLGDHLPALEPAGLELLHITLREADFTAAVPVFDGNTIPAVWYKQESNKLYVFNFTDTEATFELDPVSLGLPGGRYIDPFTQDIWNADTGRIVLPAHGSACLHALSK